MARSSSALQIALRHFGREAVAALASKGVTVRGLHSIPDQSGSFLNAETGYLVDDNGTGRLWTYAETREAAK